MSKVEAAIELARKAITSQISTDPDFRAQCLRIAFLDAISYDPTTKADGPNGSIRLWEGLDKDEPMKKAIEKLDVIKERNDITPYVSYADIYQLAGIEVVKFAGGPSIEFQYGRMDLYIPIDSSKFPKIYEESTSAQSLKDAFHRIGFNDKEIVALSAAYYYWLNCSRLEQPKIDNSYYVKLLEEESKSKLKASSSTPTTPNASTPSIDTQPSKKNTTTSELRYWKCLLSDDSFRQHVHLFSKDPKGFVEVYVNAHKKLSELGFKVFPQPILKEVEYHEMKHGIAFAVAMTILFGVVGFFYEIMRT